MLCVDSEINVHDIPLADVRLMLNREEGGGGWEGRVGEVGKGRMEESGRTEREVGEVRGGWEGGQAGWEAGKIQGDHSGRSGRSGEVAREVGMEDTNLSPNPSVCRIRPNLVSHRSRGHPAPKQIKFGRLQSEFAPRSWLVPILVAPPLDAVFVARHWDR